MQPAGLYRRIALLSCASGHHEPFVEDPPISRDLDAFAARLQRLCDGSPLLKLERAGGVEYNGFSTPIWVVRYRPPGAERRVLITGGVHGNEPAGCAWVGQLVERIADRPQLYRNVSFDLVPLVNPWGWSREIRSLGYPIEQDVRMVILRTRDGLIDAPRWGLRYMRLTGQLSITNYLRSVME